MKKTTDEAAFEKEQKQLLGRAIKAIRTENERGYISLRKLESLVKIPASNLKYIEDGINAPSPEAYDAIITHLMPTDSQRRELDRLYSLIRKAPPPDVSRIMCNNAGLNDAMRIIANRTLTDEQLAQIKKLLLTFKDA